MLDREATIESVAATETDASKLELATFDAVAVSGALGLDLAVSERNAEALPAVEMVAVPDMVSPAERDWPTVSVTIEEREVDNVALALL
jgi:hypothetical protein